MGRPPRCAAILLLSLLPVLWHSALAADSSSPQSLSGTPTIHSLGLRFVNEGDDDQDATFTVQYKAAAESAWKAGHPLIKVTSSTANGVTTTTYATSLFFLEPAATYDLAVGISDPDGTTTASMASQAMTRPDQVPEAILRTLYVAPTGSDSNPGTAPAAPLRTIQRAADLAQPGDRVLVAPGVYREQVTVTQSGTPANPIVFESEQHATTQGANPAILEGSEAALAVIDAVDNWLPDDHNPPHQGVYFTTLSSWAVTENPIYVAQGAEKLYAYWYYPYNPAVQTFERFLAGEVCSAACPSGQPCCPSSAAGGYYYDSAAKRLYVKLPEGGDPDDSVMHAVKRNSKGLALRGARHVILRGFETRFFHTGVSLMGDAGQETRENVVERNAVHHTQFGISVGGWSTTEAGLLVNDNLIQDNQIFDDNVVDWPWSAVKLNDVESTGIGVGAGSANVIRRNMIFEVFNGIDMTAWWDAQNPAYNANTDVEENAVFDTGDDAIELDSAHRNTRVFRNAVYNSGRAYAGQAAVSLAPITVGPAWVLRNTLVNARQTAFKFAADYDFQAGPVFIYHNTVYADNDDLFALLRLWSPLPSGGLRATFRNNAFLAAGTEGPGNGYGYLLEDILASHTSPPAALDLDYNAWHSARANSCGVGCRLFTWRGSSYLTLAAFQTASGQEAHGLDGDPLFTDPAARDFRLRAGSPLIDRGAPIPGVNDGFAGSGPDIGVLESPPANPVSGDVNGDGSVTLQDLVAAAADFRKPIGQRLYPPSGNSPGSDVNSDGAVDILDLVLVAQAISRG